MEVGFRAVGKFAIQEFSREGSGVLERAGVKGSTVREI